MHASIEVLTAALCYALMVMNMEHVCRGSERETPDRPTSVMIRQTELVISDNVFRVRYEISNDSNHDVWVFAGWGQSGVHAAMSLDVEKQALVVSSRLERPRQELRNQAFGRYVRLRPRETQAECIALALPVYVNLTSEKELRQGDVALATQVILEMGYYDEDLPRTVDRLFEKARESPDARENTYPQRVALWLGGELAFNETNEGLSDRRNEIVMIETLQTLQGEQVAQLVVNGTRIAYKKECITPSPRPPDLGSCARVEIRYEPSMLEYFFPYASQQSLLSREEHDYLNSEGSVVLNSREPIQALGNELRSGFEAHGVVRQRTAARVTCRRDHESPVSFTIDNDESVSMEGMHRFMYPEGFPTLKRFTPRIQAIASRVQCAAHLMDLWTRCCLYPKAVATPGGAPPPKEQPSYPEPMRWCDAVVHACERIGMEEDYYIYRPFVCPGAVGAKCHYAMNPTCEPNSPGDTVLLFETKGGWNQHGGSELFTFDNHDPKGGCVLLNDGTVKFIRTEEELKQLRWK